LSFLAIWRNLYRSIATIIERDSPENNAETMFGKPAAQHSNNTQSGRNNINVRFMKGHSPPNSSSEPSSMARIVVTDKGSTGIMLFA